MIGEYKLHSQGECVVDSFGGIHVECLKVDEYCTGDYNRVLQGGLHFSNLPEGTKVRVTLEIIE